MLGYRHNDGKLTVVPEEAETVRMIFDYYITGMGVTAVMKTLNANHIKTRYGNP